MENSDIKPVLIFYAYARQDESLRDELAKHLALLRRQGLIRDWYDRRIEPGAEWEEDIDHHLRSAQIILPLISPDFIDSDYCYDIEMKRAMERHQRGEARVIPVILRPCDWKNAPFAKLQALPRDAKPVTQWDNQDEAFLSVADGIRMVLDEFAPSRAHSRRARLGLEELSPVEQVRIAVQESRPDQLAAVRTFMAWCLSELVRLAPDFTQSIERDDLIVQAIDRTKQLVCEFAAAAEMIALMHATEAARAMYKGFGPILQQYSAPPGYSGPCSEIAFDHFKFLGHELFTVFFSYLIRDERWQLIADLLSEGIYVPNAQSGSPEAVSYAYASTFLKSLRIRNKRLGLRRISLHSEMLNSRHSEGSLAEISPKDEFVGADYFLFLRSILRNVDGRQPEWIPWSTLYMQGAPRFLVESHSSKYASGVMIALATDDIETLREGVQQSRTSLRRFFRKNPLFDPFGFFNTDEIGSM